MSLEGDFECRLKTQRASPAVGVFVCADAVIDAIVDPDDPSVRLARTVRYEHSSNHSISLCEVGISCFSKREKDDDHVEGSLHPLGHLPFCIDVVLT